jgi:hypothetical protein
LQSFGRGRGNRQAATSARYKSISLALTVRVRLKDGLWRSIFKGLPNDQPLIRRLAIMLASVSASDSTLP